MSEQDLWILIAFCFGTICGSFGNVVIFRLPKNEDLVFSRSRCVKCRALIPWYLNIPVFSWFFFEGKMSGV